MLNCPSRLTAAVTADIFEEPISRPVIILFFFILVLEESGYLPRAAFLLDRLMGGVGLSGQRGHGGEERWRLRS